MLNARLALTMMTLGSSVLSFVGYTLFIKHLGTSAAVDLLFYVGSMPLALAGTASGVLLYLLPPHLTRLSPRRQSSSVRAIAGAVLVVALISCGVTMLTTLWHQRFTLSLLLTGFMLTAAASIVAALALSLAQARGVYLSSGLSPLIASSGLLLGALCAIGLRVEWLLLVGQFLGAVGSVTVAVHGLRLHRIRGQRQDVALGLRALRPLRPHALAIALGTTAFTLFQPIDAALCTLIGGGAVTIMAYALRVAVATGTAVSLGAFAVAARTSRDALDAQGRPGLYRLARREAGRIALCGLVVWLSFALGAQQLLVHLLASTSLPGADVARLVGVLFWILLGVGPMAAVPYFFRVFYSLGMYRTPATIGVCIAPIYGLLGWWGLQAHGLLALGHAYAFVWWAAFAACIVTLRRAAQHAPSITT